MVLLKLQVAHALTDAFDFVDLRMFLDFSTLVSAVLGFLALAVLFAEAVLFRDLASFAAAPRFLVFSAVDFAFPLPAAFLAAFWLLALFEATFLS